MSAVTITIAIDSTAGATRIQITGVDPAACDCGADQAGEHDPLCASIIPFEPLHQRAWPWWFRRPRHHRPARRRHP